MTRKLVRVVFHCPEEHVSEIDRMAEDLRLQRADICRWAIERYIEQGGGVPSGSIDRSSSEPVEAMAVPV